MLIIKLAFRNVLRNKRRSLLTLLSMGGGFFLLSLTLSMSEGSYSNIIDIFTRDHTGHIQIHQGDYLNRPSLYKTINHADNLIKQLNKNKNIIGIAPRIYAPSLAYAKDKTFPAHVIGIDPLRESLTTRLKSKVTQGHYLSNDKTDKGYFGAMIGFSLAKNLHLTLGDELILISQGIDGSIANDIFIVTAIVGDANAYERMNIYLNLDAIRQFLSMESSTIEPSAGQVHELAILLSDLKQARDFAQTLQQKLNLNLNANINANNDPQNRNESNKNKLTVSPWQVVESSFYKGMQADKKGSYISMAIIIFIVSIGVLNTILMGTLERTREFGVLKSIGTRPSAVFTLIMLESFVLAVISCLLGLLISIPVNFWLSIDGIAMPEKIEMGGIVFDTMLGELSWYVISLPTLVVIASTLVVSLIPAIKAAQISPLKALQSA